MSAYLLRVYYYKDYFTQIQAEEHNKKLQHGVDHVEYLETEECFIYYYKLSSYIDKIPIKYLQTRCTSNGVIFHYINPAIFKQTKIKFE